MTEHPGPPEASFICPICPKGFWSLSAFYRHLTTTHQANQGERTKFNNRKVELDGYVFDSGAEAQRYGELRLLERAGEISELQVHPRFGLYVYGQLIGHYTADFSYRAGRGDSLHRVVEDVKSEETRKHREYRRNLKLMKACLGITVTEVLR